VSFHIEEHVRSIIFTLQKALARNETVNDKDDTKNYNSNVSIQRLHFVCCLRHGEKINHLNMWHPVVLWKNNIQNLYQSKYNHIETMEFVCLKSDMFRPRIGHSQAHKFYNHIMTTVTLASSLCVLKTVVSFRMTYLRSQHLALLDAHTLLSKHSCVLTDTNFAYYIHKYLKQNSTEKFNFQDCLVGY